MLSRCETTSLSASPHPRVSSPRRPSTPLPRRPNGSLRPTLPVKTFSTTSNNTCRTACRPTRSQTSLPRQRRSYGKPTRWPTFNMHPWNPVRRSPNGSRASSPFGPGPRTRSAAGPNWRGPFTSARTRCALWCPTSAAVSAANTRARPGLKRHAWPRRRAAPSPCAGPAGRSSRGPISGRQP
jgi:hypothetical protein